MRAPLVQNFRGQRALVALADDANCATLVATLGRLGLRVDQRDPSTLANATDLDGCDVIFFDADHGPGSGVGEAPAAGVPLVALIGIEAPSRLAGVVRRRAAAYIMKPVRSSGVFTALYVAFNEHASRRREAEERQLLDRRLAGRRELVKAIITLMNHHGIDDEDAFQRLRRESMRRRVTIEAVAKEILAGPSETSPGRHPGRELPKRKLISDRR